MKLLTTFLIGGLLTVTTVSAAAIPKDMTNKTALCLGCTRGIGEAAARQLASLGANVVVAGRSVDDGQKIANDIGGMFVKCDMGQRDQLEHAFETTIETYGGIDAVFSNGGTEGELSPLDDISSEVIDNIGRVNGLSTLHVYDLAVRAFLQNGSGSLVFTSSIAAFFNEAMSEALPSSGAIYYVGTKAIAPAMTRASGMLTKQHNIRVYALAPAVYDTKMVHDVVFKSTLASKMGVTTKNEWALLNPVLAGCASDPNNAALAAVAMLSNNTHWPPSSVIVADGPFTFESNVLSDNFGRNQVWTRDTFNVELLHDAYGAPVQVTNQDIEDMIALCAAEQPDDKEL